MALPFVLALLTGCDPHDAEITGSYAMYFAEATSDNVLRLRTAETPVSCDYEDSDPEGDFNDEDIFTDECWKQKVEAEKAFQEKWDFTPIDCRDFWDSSGIYDGNMVLVRDGIIPGWEEDFEKYCCEEALDDDESNDPDGDFVTHDDCTLRSIPHNTWIDGTGYYLNTGKLESWREEAVLTTEGDIQLTFHVQTPYGDTRLAWVIDPDFQPTECVDVDGKSTLRDVDGNWLEGWSGLEDDDDGYTVFHINAGSYQINPNNGAEYWSFDNDWSAAAAHSRFGDETSYLRATEYVDADAVPYWVSVDDAGEVTGGYEAQGSRYEELNCGDDDTCLRFADYADFVDMMKDNFQSGGTNRDDVEVPAVKTELERFARLPWDEFPLHYRIEDNSWRPTAEGAGDKPDGLDNWVGVSSSYVRLKISREDLAALESGTLASPLEGDFQFGFDSAESTGTVWFYRGEFSITRLEPDTYGFYPELETIKVTENETPSCGE